MNVKVAPATASIASTANTSTITLPPTAARASSPTGIEIPTKPTIKGTISGELLGRVRLLAVRDNVISVVTVVTGQG
jgi:hypothetical protein